MNTMCEVQAWLNECKSVGIEPDMSRQLLAAMEREERLREALAMVRKDKWFPAMLEQTRVAVMNVIRNDYQEEK